jgi:acyl dehydratase
MSVDTTNPLEALLAAVGQQGSPRTAWDEVSRGEIRRYAQAVMDPDRLYWDEDYARGTRYGGVVAPPFLPCKMFRVPPDAPDPLREDLGTWSGEHTPRGESDLHIPWPRGWIVLHGSDEAEIYRLARPGDRVTAQTTFTDAYERQGRSGHLVMGVTETTYSNQHGDLLYLNRGVSVARQVGAGGKAGSKGAGASSLAPEPAPPGRVVPRGTAFEEIQVGDGIPTVVKPLTVPIMMRWCAAVEIWRRDHYDLTYAVEQAGLPNIVGSGAWTHACLHHVLSAWAGLDGWVFKVSQRVKTTMLPGDTLTGWGRVTATRIVDGLGHVDLETGFRKADGVDAISGGGTVVLPLRGGRPVPYPFPRRSNA